MDFENFKVFNLSGTVSINRLSKRIGFSEADIISLLESSGFENFTYSDLKQSHLDIISKAYVKSIKAFYNTVSNKYFNLNNKKQRELKIFFSKFSKNSNDNIFWSFYKKDNVFEVAIGGELDVKLIEEHFDDIVLELKSNGLFSRFNKYLDRPFVLNTKLEDSDFERIFNKYKHKIKLKIRIVNLFNDIRSKLCFIMICNNYHIFNDDEDNNIEANTRISFSRYILITKEALKIITNLKQQPEWKPILKSL